METIVKILRSFFGMDENGEVKQTSMQKFKDALLYMIVGAAILIGAVCYFVDDDETTEQTTTEQVSQDDEQTTDGSEEVSDSTAEPFAE